MVRLSHFIYTNPRFGAPSQHGKWDDKLQQELPIDAILIHKFPRMYMEGERNFKQHLQAPDVSNHVISVNVDSQIAYKMPDLGHLLSTGNGMINYNKSYPLMLS